jgi:hypothetical protein
MYMVPMQTRPISKLLMPNAFDRNEPNLPPGAREVLATIRLHGWVYAPTDDHAYTTGLGWRLKAPEIVVCAQVPHVARDLLAEACRQLSAGVKLTPSQPHDGFFDDCPVFFQPVAKHHYDSYLGWSVWFYGGYDFDCLQMVVPDSTGRFPWQPDFDPAETQPDLSAGSWHGQA